MEPNIAKLSRYPILLLLLKVDGLERNTMHSYNSLVSQLSSFTLHYLSCRHLMRARSVSAQNPLSIYAQPLVNLHIQQVVILLQACSCGEVNDYQLIIFLLYQHIDRSSRAYDDKKPD